MALGAPTPDEARDVSASLTGIAPVARSADHAPVPDADVRRALDGIVHRLLPSVLAVAGALVGGLAVFDLLVHPAPVSFALAAANGASALAFFAVARMAHAGRIREGSAQTAFLVAQALALPAASLGAIAMPGAHNAFILAIFIVGGSAILLSWQHYAALAGLVVGSAITLGRAGLLDPATYANVLVVGGATALGAMLEISRLTSHHQLARLTLAERGRRERLERAYEALAESEDRFERVLASIPEAFWIHENRAGRVVFASPAFEPIWGRSRAELYEDPLAWERSLHPEDRARAIAERAAVGEEEDLEQEYRVVRPDGTVRWVRDRVFRVRDATGATRGIAGIAEDVTLKREVEATLRRSERLSTLGTLVAGVAHEVNNPLTFIRANAELTAESLDAALAREDLSNDLRRALEEAREGTRITHEGIARIQHITTSLKQVARTGDAPRGIEDASALAESALAVARPRIAQSVAIERSYAASGRVRASATELTQVLLNLVLNASEALGRDGGTITLRTRDEGSSVVIEVSDSGPGIPRDVQAKLFTPFFTTKPHGTGLGLSIAHGIVTEHGGKIAVESAQGAGATFRVILPAD